MDSNNPVDIVRFAASAISEGGGLEVLIMDKYDSRGGGGMLRSSKGTTYVAKRTDTPMRSLIGIIQASGRITLVPAQLNRLTLPSVSSLGYASNNLDRSLGDISKEDRSRLLIDSFGSSRQKRVMRSRIANEINDESLDLAVTNAQESMRSTNPDSDNDDLMDGGLIDDILPRYNVYTTEPSKVYILEDIVREDELAMLTDEAKYLCSRSTDQELQQALTPCAWSYFCDHVMSIPSEFRKPSDAQSIRQCTMLIFLKYLMQMHQAGVRMLNKKAPFLCDAPIAIQSRLFDEFVSDTGASAKNTFPKRITERSKQKLLNHILILALFIDNFSTKLSYFVKDLKISRNKMCNSALSIGCQIKPVLDDGPLRGSIPVARLVAPIKFTNLPQKKFRRR